MSKCVAGFVLRVTGSELRVAWCTWVILCNRLFYDITCRDVACRVSTIFTKSLIVCHKIPIANRYFKISLSTHPAILVCGNRTDAVCKTEAVYL